MPALANTLPEPLFAAFWENLRCSGCRAYHEVPEVGDEKVLIIQWEGFFIFDAGSGDSRRVGSHQPR